MNKLLLSGVGALALLAAVGATSVSAWSILSSTSNSAVVINDVEVEANSGDNSQRTSGRSSTGGLMNSGDSAVRGRNSMTTGDAYATAEVATEANNDCGCEGDMLLSSSRNRAFVVNDVEVEAESGDNSQSTRGRSRTGGLLNSGDSTVRGRNSMSTGRADALGTTWTIVNSSATMN